MNSRNRVRAVLEHKMPDRVPLGLGGCETAGLHLLAYSRLNELLAIKNSQPRLDTCMMNAVFEQDVILRMEGDIILLASPRMCSAPLWGEGSGIFWKNQELWGNRYSVPVSEKFSFLEDGSIIWNEERICPPGAQYFDEYQANEFNLDFQVPDPAGYNPPHFLDDKLLRQLEKAAGELYTETEFSICCGETITDLQVHPGGYINHFFLIKEEPDIMHEYLAKSVDAAIAQLKELDQAIGKYTDILSIAHDFGDNRGITIGAESWRTIYKPHYKKLFSKWHEISQMKINLHSCGSIIDILPDLIECGVDIYNPVQISAVGMNAEKLKCRFGSDVIFYGGAYDAQIIAGSAGYEEVYDHVKANVECLKKSGGYIMAGVHNLPGNLPKSHLQALLDAFIVSRDY